jgi:hypothetical protein
VSDKIIFPPLDLARTCESLMCLFTGGVSDVCHSTIRIYTPLWYVDFAQGQFVTNFCMYTKSFSYSITLVNYQACDLCRSRQLAILIGRFFLMVRPLASFTIPSRNALASPWRDSRFPEAPMWFPRYASAPNSSHYAGESMYQAMIDLGFSYASRFISPQDHSCFGPHRRATRRRVSL